MPSLRDQLNKLSAQFKSLSTPRLDAELLLCYVLQLSRVQLHAYDERQISAAQLQSINSLVVRRLAGESIAHILGEKEFWSQRLFINQHTLIPRPETEHLVEIVLATLPTNNVQRVIDLGTGSGAIALALAQERKHWQLTATDIDPQSLQVAQQNAERLSLQQVQFLLGDWYQALPASRYHAIVSNPPYLAEDDPHLTQDSLRFEPRRALVAGADGLAALQTVIAQAPAYLYTDGWLFVEHGCSQGDPVQQLMIEAGFKHVITAHDWAGLERITYAKFH